MIPHSNFFIIDTEESMNKNKQIDRLMILSLTFLLVVCFISILEVNDLPLLELISRAAMFATLGLFNICIFIRQRWRGTNIANATYIAEFVILIIAAIILLGVNIYKIFFPLVTTGENYLGFTLSWILLVGYMIISRNKYIRKNK